MSLGNRIFYRNYDASKFSLVEYKSTSFGIGSNLGFPINAINRINFGVTLSKEELSQLSEYEQTRIMRESFLNPEDPDAGFDFTKLELSLGWSRITLNRGLFPTAGSKQTFTLKGTTPGSDLTYFKVNYDSKFYWPISNNHKWSFMTRAAFGYGNGYGTTNGYDQILPVQDFFRITESELRGFDRNTILPRAISRLPLCIDGTPNPDGTKDCVAADPKFDQIVPQGRIGGNAKALAGLELIVPTPFLDDDNTSSVRTSFFVDAANVWDTEFNVNRFSNLSPDEKAKLDDYSNPSRFRVATGMSVQWISPMGPMVISFAYPLKKEEDDKTKSISFNISNTF